MPSSTKVITGKVRLSYANLVQPKLFEGQDKAKYSTVLLIPKKDKKTLAKIKLAIKTAYTEAKDSKLKGVRFEKLKTTLRDGDNDDSIDLETNPEYAGHYFMNVSSTTKPGIVDMNLDPILDSTEIYSGMYARASINFFAFNTQGNKGVSAGLNNIQKLADGDPLGGRARAEDDFDDDFTDSYDEEDVEDDDLLG